MSTAKLAQDDGCLADSLRAVTRDIAGGWCVDTQGIETVAIKVCLDDVAGASVDILAHAVKMKFPNELVGPWMVIEVEIHWLPPCRISDRCALVARGGENVLATSQG